MRRTDRRPAHRRRTASDTVLPPRTDGQLLKTPTSLADSIHRANLCREAGADCLFVPGINDLDTIKTLVKEIDGPRNVVIGLGSSDCTAHELLAAGVQRISLGGSIARAALGFIRAAAQELLTTGTLARRSRWAMPLERPSARAL